MRRVRAIHQAAPAFPLEDAIGNQMARIRKFLRERGIESQVYVLARDLRRKDPGLEWADYPSHPDNVLIYHYSTGTPLSQSVARLPDQVVVYYHNVTPPRFFEKYDPLLASVLEQGRQEIALFKDRPLALAASEFNRQEMLALGFGEVRVVPPALSLDDLLAADGPEAQEIVARYDDGWVNLLCVGRLAPNKRQDELIRAFTYYHRLINPRSRLFLVGSNAGLPAYRLDLESLAASLGHRHVHFPGRVSVEALAGYYRVASVFLSLSEHEGFGIPLLEAMAFDVPVLAFKAAGVPYTMGDAGVLLTQKRYDVIGELIDILVRDEDLRGRIVQRQRERVREVKAWQAEALGGLGDWVTR